ncbi:MAG: CpsD/CapB family tyrosine-protein kinase [Chloroflexi bacterium]|nr:CpsD/CapB family tyrosine-protein kinase [Chloroflexota bacterium]
MANATGLVTIDEPLSPAAEAYRTLRMNLQFAALDKRLRSILVTSPGAGEGKTTVLANLGITMAQVETRVLLVDCDLRKPQLHTFFGLTNERGLTTMLLEEEAFAHPPIQETSIPNLRLLASGALPPRPADLLGSQRMEKALARLQEEADILLFDAPPLMAAADAVVLATKVDAVLLVVSAGQTKREQTQRALERLAKVNAHIVGAVLNNAPLEDIVQGYYR